MIDALKSVVTFDKENKSRYIRLLAMTKLYVFIFTIFFLCTKAFGLEYGIDRLSEPEIIKHLSQKRIALLAHSASVNKRGQHLIDLMASQFRVKKIFSPEHGLRTLEDGWVEDGVDPVTKTPVISLYKNTTRAPNPKDLKDIDVVVIDLQDVGLRYYTYFSTLALMMKTCADLGIEVVILDRPNLLGGEIIEGKTLDKSLAGNFIAFHTIPTRHGMTLAELALMYNEEAKIKAKVSVIKTLNWKREEILFKLDRPWKIPSPALITPKQVALYAYFGNLEHLELAVGRGKTNELAFSAFGAPWISAAESQKLANDLNALSLPGFRFKDYSWTVTRAKFEGEIARGIKIEWNGLASATDEVNYRVALIFFKNFREKLKPNKMFAQSLGDEELEANLKKQIPWKGFASEINLFKTRRLKYLLYP